MSWSYDDAAGPYVDGSVMLAGNPSDGLERCEAAGTHTQDWRIGASTDVRKLTFELTLASGSDKRSF